VVVAFDVDGTEFELRRQVAMDSLFFQVRQEVIEERGVIDLLAIIGLTGVAIKGARHLLMDIVSVQRGQTDLPKITLTLGSIGGFANPLNGGYDEPDEDSNDRDNHEQFEQREGAVSTEATSTHGSFPESLRFYWNVCG